MTSGKGFHIFASGYTHPGRKRGSNEDSFLIANLSEGVRFERNSTMKFHSGPLGTLFAVADGMGGAAAGEMASRLGVRRLYYEVQELVREVRHPGDSELQQILVEAVGMANRRIYETARSDSELAGMGTTLTAVLEMSGRLVIGQVGDSRAYLLRDEGIRQLTRDQSLVGQRVSSGELTEEEARRHPQRNILLQALGVRPSVELALLSAVGRPGDVLLLCSDGLHSQMSSGEIYEVVAGSNGPQDACEELVALANDRGGPDNITALLIQFQLQ